MQPIGQNAQLIHAPQGQRTVYRRGRNNSGRDEWEPSYKRDEEGHPIGDATAQHVNHSVIVCGENDENRGIRETARLRHPKPGRHE